MSEAERGERNGGYGTEENPDHGGPKGPCGNVAAGERAAVIAVKLGVCPDTVYKELKRGYTGTLNELSRPAYDPARGQAEYQRRLRNRGRWRRDKEEHHGAEAET